MYTLKKESRNKKKNIYSVRTDNIFNIIKSKFLYLNKVIKNYFYKKLRF